MTTTFRGLAAIGVLFAVAGLGASLDVPVLSLALACGSSLLLLLADSLRRTATRMRRLDEGAIVLERQLRGARAFIGMPLDLDVAIRMSNPAAPSLLARIVARESAVLAIDDPAAPAGCPRQWIRALSGRDAVQLSYRLTPTTSGTMKVPPFSISFLDEWGLFDQHKELDDALQAEVWPTEMRAFLTRPHRVATTKAMLAGIHQLKRAGMGSEMHEIRPFRPGDPSRKISWPVTARKGTLMVREVETEVPVPVLVLFNADESMRLGARTASSYDRGFELLLALIDASERVRDPIGAYVCTDEHTHQGPRYVPPSISRINRYRILKAILSCRAGMPSAQAVDRRLFDDVMVAHFGKVLWSGPSLFGRRQDLLRAGAATIRRGGDTGADDFQAMRDYAWRHGLPIPHRPRDFAAEEQGRDAPGGGVGAIIEALRHLRRSVPTSTVVVVVSGLPRDAAALRDVVGELKQLRAERHQVIVIVPLIASEGREGSWSAARDLLHADAAGSAVTRETVRQTMVARELTWLERTRAGLAALGVPLLTMATRDNVRQVMNAVNRVRREAGARKW